MGTVEIPHDLDFLKQALLAVLLAVSRLLGKCLHCVLPAVFELLSEVDRGEVALPYLLDGLELLVEAQLVEVSSQDISPSGCLPVLQLKSELLVAEVEGDGVLAHHEPQLEIEDHVSLAILDASLVNLNCFHLLIACNFPRGFVEECSWTARRCVGEKVFFHCADFF